MKLEMSFEEYYEEKFRSHLSWANAYEKINKKPNMFSMGEAVKYLEMSIDERTNRIVKKHCR